MRSRNVSYIASNRVIARAFVVLVYLFQSFFENLSLTNCKNSCGGRASCTLKYLRAWCGARRASYLKHPGPSTLENCRYYNYLFIGRMFTHATRKDLLYDCSRHVQRKHHELYILYIVSFYTAYVTHVHLYILNCI